MIEFLTFFLSVILTVWYLREPEEIFTKRRREENLNQNIDEWNARELIETENYYE